LPQWFLTQTKGADESQQTTMEKMMKLRFVWSTTLLACMALTLMSTNCSAQQTDSVSKGRPTISEGERALAMMEVQNVFSKHAFYHQASLFCEEMEDIWVKEDGPNAATATWNNGGRMQAPYSMIKLNYCTNHYKAMQKTLTELSKKDPSVKDIPQNIGAGMEYVMHTQETPVIEVAQDGKTAKGLWYSIGQGVRPVGTTGKSTEWMWEKYAVDFIKEDGKWKMWHLINMMDVPPQTGSSSASAAGGPGGAPGAAPSSAQPKGAAAGGAQPAGANVGTGVGGGQLVSTKTVKVFEWSPTVVPVIEPKFPEPYYTFSETFSY
jgi:hypothetical protein